MRTVRNKRVERGLSMSDLARRSGVSVSGISRIEHNDVRSPSVDTVRKLARGLGVSVSELLEEAELTSDRGWVRPKTRA
jgi:transcriptional regulator with XRE-family HTH domain